MTPMPPSNVPSDDGSSPQASPADGGEVRARALADFFGGESRGPVAEGQVHDPTTADRLAEFFARPPRRDPVDAPVPAQGAPAPTLDHAPTVDPAPDPAGAEFDGVPSEADRIPADDAEPDIADAIPPAAPTDDELFALDDDDLLSYDADDLFMFDADGELIPLDDAPGVPIEASAPPSAVAPEAVAAAAVVAGDAEAVTVPGRAAAGVAPPGRSAERRPPSQRATKREARRAAKAAAAAQAAQGEFASTPRGMRAWSKGTWWSVGIAVALILMLVAASITVSQLLQAQAEELAAATAEFEAAADAADEPVPAMEAAYAEYDTTAAAARAAADSATPALAAVAGMSDQPALDAANAAAGAVIALLDSTTLPERPAAYDAPDVTTIDDVQSAEDAAADARAYSGAVAATTEEVKAATAAVTQQVTALTEAQRALGATLPATAEGIAAENDLAFQSFRDDVIATAAAVGAAQSAGASGDAELLAYAAAVSALREDQLRAEEEASRRFFSAPVTPEPEPAPPTQEQPPAEEQPPPEEQPPADPVEPIVP